MKKITILFLFISSLSLINAQSSDIDSVKALKVDRNIVTLSQSTKDKFDSNGLTFYINQYYHKKIQILLVNYSYLYSIRY